MDLGTTPLLKHRDTETIPRAACCSKEEERENRQCRRATSMHTHTHTHSCHTGARREKETKSKFQAASRRLYPPGPAGQNGFAHRAQKIHLHTLCLTIIIIQKGLLFIWLPSSTQSWCISQGLSDLASPQLCSTTTSCLIPAPSIGIIRRRRSPHSTLISFSTRSPCRIN